MGVIVAAVMNRPPKAVGHRNTLRSYRSDRSTRTTLYVIPSITAVRLEKERGASERARRGSLATGSSHFARVDAAEMKHRAKRRANAPEGDQLDQAPGVTGRNGIAM